MSAPRDGGPAFPSGDNDSPVAPFEAGISARDYFAAAALPACIAWHQKFCRNQLLGDGEPPHAQPALPCCPDDEDFNEVADAAYLFADAMLRFRENS